MSIATGQPAFGIRSFRARAPSSSFSRSRPGRAAPAPRPARTRTRDRPDLLVRTSTPPRTSACGSTTPIGARLTETANESGASRVPRPIARLRRAGLDENSQREYAVVIEAMRDIARTQRRRHLGRPTGHTGENMRGTSGLESVSECRLRKRDGNTVTVNSEHREAEPGDPSRSTSPGTTRPEPCGSDRPALNRATCLDYLADNGPATTDEIATRDQHPTLRRQARPSTTSKHAGTARRQPVPRTTPGTAHPHQSLGSRCRCGIETHRRAVPQRDGRTTEHSHDAPSHPLEGWTGTAHRTGRSTGCSHDPASDF